MSAQERSNNTRMFASTLFTFNSQQALFDGLFVQQALITAAVKNYCTRVTRTTTFYSGFDNPHPYCRTYYLSPPIEIIAEIALPSTRIHKSASSKAARTSGQLPQVLPGELVLSMSEGAPTKPGAGGGNVGNGDRKPAVLSPAATKRASVERDNSDNTSGEESHETRQTASDGDNADNTSCEEDRGSAKPKRKRRKESSGDGIEESPAHSLATAVGSPSMSLQEKWDEMFNRLLRFKVCS